MGYNITFNICTHPVEDQISIRAKRPIFPEEVLRTKIPEGMSCQICLSRRITRSFKWGYSFPIWISKGFKVIFPEGQAVKAIFSAG